MRILISTGIYPPKIGGPSEYSKNLENTLKSRGHQVYVSTYGIEGYLPTGIRHLVFFFKILPKAFLSDLLIVMDTFSVGFPTVLASKVFFKKTIIRTGGDFLWENYVERTKKKVRLGNFYQSEIKNFNLKDKIIFKLTKWTLRNCSKLVFSTRWQRDIFIPVYDLDINKIEIIENYYGEKEEDFENKDYCFVGSSRKLVWKNLDLLEEVFKEIPNAKLNLENQKFNDYMNTIRNSYAVIQVSIGDISPNMILDAIRMNKPFICTKEVGIYDRIKDAGIFVDPMNKDEIKKAVLDLLNEDNYRTAKEKVRNFKFTHTWGEIADEFISMYKKI